MLGYDKKLRILGGFLGTDDNRKHKNFFPAKYHVMQAMLETVVDSYVSIVVLCAGFVRLRHDRELRQQEQVL